MLCWQRGSISSIPQSVACLNAAPSRGQVVHRGAVAALAPEETAVDGRLIALVRKDLVRPEQPLVADDEAFRFRHLLIRDTAYEALPKAVRAELHERFAGWLQSHADELIESDELVGYHLAEAYRCRVELGPARRDRPRTRTTRSRPPACERRAGAGSRRRLGPRALLGQAIELLPAGSRSRPAARVELAAILAEHGDFAQAEALREEAASAARMAPDDGLLARLELNRVEAGLLQDPTMTLRDALAVAEQALADLERVGDDEGVVLALLRIGTFKAWPGAARKRTACGCAPSSWRRRPARGSRTRCRSG